MTTKQNGLSASIERILKNKGLKGMDYYLEMSKKLGRSIYEVLCDIEKAIDYDELSRIFSEYSGYKLVKEVKEDNETKVTPHYIETSTTIYIWHPASTDVVGANGQNKEIVLISKKVFDSYVVKGVKLREVTFISSTKEWFIQKILIPALQTNVTDIHIVPKESTNTYRIYFRLLGELRDILSLPEKEGRSVVSMLLYWAKEFTPSIRIDDTRRPQDGRVVVTKEQTGMPIDMRLSFIPKPNMADIDVVARLLYKVELHSQSLHGLGFYPDHEKLMLNASLRNQGLILVTGATGSGKSMTINTILSKIDPSRNVLTVEDPVEYMLPNARQFQTFEWEGSGGKENKIDFAHYARAFKRHDPDVIFIGELRDKITADTALHLSKTGHLVFATLHTSRATMVPEMLHHDYGISINEIADNLLMVVNQVLVKRLCPKCYITHKLDALPEWFSLLSFKNKDEAVKTLIGNTLKKKKPDTGASCGCIVRYGNTIISSGYSGRTVVAECIAFDPHMFAGDNISVSVMDEKTLQKYGNILGDAVRKVIDGVIDIDSIRRLI